MHQVAAYEFHEQHLSRIDTCELITKLMWQEYLRERSPYRRVSDLEGNKGNTAIPIVILSDN